MQVRPQFSARVSNVTVVRCALRFILPCSVLSSLLYCKCVVSFIAVFWGTCAFTASYFELLYTITACHLTKLSGVQTKMSIYDQVFLFISRHF